MPHYTTLVCLSLSFSSVSTTLTFCLNRLSIGEVITLGALSADASDARFKTAPSVAWLQTPRPRSGGTIDRTRLVTPARSRELGPVGHIPRGIGELRSSNAPFVSYKTRIQATRARRPVLVDEVFRVCANCVYGRPRHSSARPSSAGRGGNDDSNVSCRRGGSVERPSSGSHRRQALTKPARACQRLPAPASTPDNTLMHEYTTRTTHWLSA